MSNTPLPTQSQLPVSSYFSQTLFEREREVLFAQGPRYLGHALMVPKLADYYALPQEDEGRALLHTDQGIALVSNVCRHRQAIMLKGSGNLAQGGSGHIVCPLHRWTYSAQGKLLGAPHFSHDPCLDLTNSALRNWQGLLFEDNGRDIAADLAGMELADAFSFEGYALGHIESHICNYNWKTFIEVYLEDYHVAPFHPGLGNFVSCDDLRWQLQPEYSVQSVGIAHALKKSGSAAYQQWQEALMRYRQGQLPERGAIWLTYYPHITLEWYPQVLIISTMHPLAVDKTLNLVAFFYPEDILAFEPALMQAQRAAYMETCFEDDEIALRMDAGRKALLQRGDNETGPYQSPMEDGMKHFHNWYRSKLAMA